MAIELADYERKAREAVRAFWGNREAARLKQMQAGKADQGERGGVTAGKNMDGFLSWPRTSCARTAWSMPRYCSRDRC